MIKTQQDIEREQAYDTLEKIYPTATKRARLDEQISRGPSVPRGIGNETWDEVTDRYRRRGADLQHRTGPTLDQTQSNQSRGLQLNALEMLRRQGEGRAPSAAEAVAQRANQNAAMAAERRATAARTTGGALAALRASGGESMAANAANAASRAGEIRFGQGAFASGAGAMQAGDIDAASANAQLEAQQRALNERAQQNYEMMSGGARTAEMTAGKIATDTMNRQIADRAAIDYDDKRREEEAILKFGGMGTSMGMSGASAMKNARNGSTK